MAAIAASPMRSHPADRPAGRINKWFSLIDKVWSGRTFELAWEKVKSNAGACGVDGITIGRFAKDSPSRQLAVNEQLKRGAYQPKAVKRVWINKPGSAEKRLLRLVRPKSLRILRETISLRQGANH
jgi:retron-type reverse transcriptase